MFQAYLFDMDGTLVDTAEIIFDSFNEALRENGLKPLPVGFYYDKVFGNAPGSIAKIIKVSDKKMRGILDDFMVHWMTRIPRAKAFQNVDATLRELRANNRKLGIVSASPHEVIKKTLETVGIYGLFDVVVGEDDSSSAKPNHEPVTLALKKLGVRAENAVFIGDTNIDIMAGNAAGCVTVLIKKESNGSKSGIEPDYTIKNIKEVLKIQNDKDS